MEAKFAYIRPNRDIAKLTWPKAAELLGHLSMVEWGDGCMRAEQLGMLPLAGAHLMRPHIVSGLRQLGLIQSDEVQEEWRLGIELWVLQGLTWKRRRDVEQ